MPEIFQGPERSFPDRAIPKAGSTGLASLSGTATIRVTGSAGLDVTAKPLVFSGVPSPSGGSGGRKKRGRVVKEYRPPEGTVFGTYADAVRPKPAPRAPEPEPALVPARAVRRDPRQLASVMCTISAFLELEDGD